MNVMQRAAATAGSAWSGQMDQMGKQATGDEPNESTQETSRERIP